MQGLGKVSAVFSAVFGYNCETDVERLWEKWEIAFQYEVRNALNYFGWPLIETLFYTLKTEIDRLMFGIRRFTKYRIRIYN